MPTGAPPSPCFLWALEPSRSGVPRWHKQGMRCKRCPCKPWNHPELSVVHSLAHGAARILLLALSHVQVIVSSRLLVFPVLTLRRAYKGSGNI